MSTRTAFSIVGAAVGAYFGNAALGYSIGSMVGGYVDPIQVKGPRISDAQQQTAQDGVPIPITYGSVRISGNVIATGKLIEHKKTDDGKGSGTETTTYYYTRTYAIGICEGPIAAVRRIWRDGKLVYDVSQQDGTANATHAANAKFAQHMDLYLGDEVQEPNSALQAIFGEEKVSAHRGLAYIVIRDDDLTDRAGSIPSYEFEVVNIASGYMGTDYRAKEYTLPLWLTNATSRVDPRSDNTYEYAYVQDDGDIEDAAWQSDLDVAKAAVAAAKGLDGLGQMMGWGYTYDVDDSAQYDFAPFNPVSAPSNALVIGLVFAIADFANIVTQIDASEVTLGVVEGGLFAAGISNGGTPKNFGAGVITSSPLPIPFTPDPFTGGDGHTYYVYKNTQVGCRVVSDCVIRPHADWLPIPDSPGFWVSPDGTIHQTGTCDTVTGTFRQLQVRTRDLTTQYITKYPWGPAVITGSVDDNQAFWEEAYLQALFEGKVASGLVYPTDYPKPVTEACRCTLFVTIIPEDPLLSDIVADLCRRKGLTGPDIDVSQLTDYVKGFTVATATSAADAINALAPAYQFDGAEFDGRTRFIKRGGPTLAALNEQDAFDSDSGRIIETRAQELELPRKMALSYMDLGANYAVTTQMAERLSATVASSGIDTVQLSVVMEHDKAAQVVDILLKDQWSSINGTLGMSVGDEFSDLVPTDVLFVSSEDALFRCRVVEAENTEGVVKLNLQQDVASAYSSVAVGVPPRPAQEGGQTITGPTFFEVMNLPALRDQDDRPGVYIAGNSPIGSWPGAQVAVSANGGVTWVDVLQMRQAATLGLLDESLGTWTPDIVDRYHVMYVGLTGGDFESVTEEQVYRGANPLCVGDEIIQFETAELLDVNYYKLNGMLTRGRRNTDPEVWVAGTRVVSLNDAYFIPLDRSYIGQTLQFRVTTFGTDVQYGTIKSLDFSVPRSAQEWSVTNLSAERDGSHTAILSWSPRHRLGTSATPYPSIYFTGYQVSITDGVTTKVYSVTAPNFTYSDSQATADFGSSPSTLDFTISATNSILGPGEPIEVTV